MIGMYHVMISRVLFVKNVQDISNLVVIHKESFYFKN